MQLLRRNRFAPDVGVGAGVVGAGVYSPFEGEGVVGAGVYPTQGQGFFTGAGVGAGLCVCGGYVGTTGGTGAGECPAFVHMVTGRSAARKNYGTF